MSHPRLLLTLSFLLLLFSSCEKVMDFSVEEQTPIVVVSALPTSDSTLLVRLTKSRFFLSDGPFPTVDDATVTVQVNGVNYPLSFLDSGNYTNPLVLREGDSLRLSVRVPGYGSITSASRVPYHPVVRDTAYYDTLLPDAIIPLEVFRFTLCDDPAVQNYYRIYMVETDSLGTYDPATDSWTYVRDTTYKVPFGIADTLLSHDLYTTQTIKLMAFYDTVGDTLMPFGNFSSCEMVFSDKHINGTDHVVHLQRDVPVEFKVGMTRTKLHPMSRRFTFYIETITYDNYRYRVTEHSASSLSSYFSEPIQVYTNISGGIGVFGGASAVSYRFTKPARFYNQ